MPKSTPETNIRFFRSGGHKHDGVSSSLIDFSKYSIFDFNTDVSLNNTDSARESTRTNNQNRFNQYIANFISTQILAPAGIVLLENSVQGRHIGADEITAIQIAANTITANEIAVGTITADKLAINVVQVGQTISSNSFVANVSGWQIRSDGSAEFNNNVTVRGRIEASSGNFTGNINVGSSSTITNANINTTTITGGVISGGSININNNTFSVAANGLLTATNAIITGNITAGSASTISGSGVTGGTISGTSININNNTFTVASNGLLTATNAIITGNITAGSGTTISNGAITNGAITGGTLTIGTAPNVFKVASNGAHWSGNATFGTSAPFRVTAGGDLYAQAGQIGGWTLSNTSISGGSTTLYSNGRIDAGNTIIYANGYLSGTGANFVNTAVTSGGAAGFGVTTAGVVSIVNGAIAGLSISSEQLSQGALTLKDALLVYSGIAGTLISGSTLSLKYNGAIVGQLEGFYDATYGNTISVNTRQFAISNLSKFDLAATGSANLNIYFSSNIGSGSGTTVVRQTSGKIVQTSSKRVLKENISPINIASELIKKFNPVTYNWRTHSLSSDVEKYFNALNTQYGFIVEEVEAVDTGLVHYDYNLPHIEGQEMDLTDARNFSPSMYDANGILSITVSALKEVLERLEALENR